MAISYSCLYIPHAQSLQQAFSLGNKRLFVPHVHERVKPGGKYWIPICWYKLSQSLSVVSNLVLCRMYT